MRFLLVLAAALGVSAWNEGENSFVVVTIDEPCENEAEIGACVAALPIEYQHVTCLQKALEAECAFRWGCMSAPTCAASADEAACDVSICERSNGGGEAQCNAATLAACLEREKEEDIDDPCQRLAVQQRCRGEAGCAMDDDECLTAAWDAGCARGACPDHAGDACNVREADECLEARLDEQSLSADSCLGAAVQMRCRKEHGCYDHTAQLECRDAMRMHGDGSDACDADLVCGEDEEQEKEKEKKGKDEDDGSQVLAILIAAGGIVLVAAVAIAVVFKKRRARTRGLRSLDGQLSDLPEYAQMSQ